MPATRKSQLAIASLCALASMLLLASVAARTFLYPPPAPSPIVEKTTQAPPIDLKTLQGGQYKLSDDKHKIVILDFWATWCGPCIQSLPHLEKTIQWAKSQNMDVAFYTINSSDTPEEISAFLKKSNLDLPVLLDPDEAVLNAYSVEGIPDTRVIIDGKITHRFLGLWPDLEDQLKSVIIENASQAPKQQSASSL